MSIPESTTTERYGRALAALAGALLAAILLHGSVSLLLLLLAAVAYGAWRGGRGPGLLLTALSSAVVLLVYARGGLLQGEIAAPILFAAVALLLVWLADGLDRVRAGSALPHGNRSSDARAGEPASAPSAHGRTGDEAARPRVAADERTAFLAQAGELLVDSLDYEETLARVARMAVPLVADWCAVDIVTPDGRIETLEVAHPDPAKVEWARSYWREHPHDPSAPAGVPNVIRTGAAEFYPLITDEMLVAGAKSPEELELARSVGYTSIMIHPLAARGRTLGAITLVTAESGKRYGQEDMALGRDLARMAALAVDNARLFHQSETRREWLDVTLASIGDAVIATDDRGRITFMNAVAEELTAWPGTEAAGRELSEVFRIINETSRLTVENPVERVLREGVVVGLANHTLLVDREGNEHPIDDSAAPIRGRDGGIIGVVLVFHDVTERRRAETELQASRDQLAVILRSVADGITVQGADGALKFANDEGARLIGYPSAEELVASAAGEAIRQFEMRDEQGNPFPADLLPGRRAMEGELNSSATIRFRRVDNADERWAIVRANPVFDEQGRVTQAINVFHDITDRVQAQKELESRYDVLQNIYHLSEAAALAENSKQIDDAALDAIEQMLGTTRSAILLFDKEGVMRFRSWRNLSDAYRAAVEGHSPWPSGTRDPKPVLVPDVGADESLAHLRDVLAAEKIGALCFIPLVYRERLIGKFMVYFEEPRVFSREEIRLGETVARHVAFAIGRWEDEEEIRFQAHLLDAVEQAVIATDCDGRIVYSNRFTEVLYGWSPEELRGRSALEIAAPESQEISERIMQRLRNGQSWTEEVLLHRRDGRTFPALVSLAPITSRMGEQIGIVGVSFDVSDRKAIMQQLREETETLDVVNETGKVLSAELDLQTLLQTVTDAATDLSGASFGAFFYNNVNPEGSSYLLYTLSGASPEDFSHLPMPRATAMFGPTFRGEGNIRIADVRTDPRFGKNPPYNGHPPGHLPVASYLAIPVISRSGEVIGGLFFGHPEVGVFTEREERIVSGLAAQAAIAIDNARLFQAAQREIEVRRQTEDELKSAKELAESANAAKDQFLAVLSHELRTPLTPVLSSVYALETGEELPEDVLQYIRIIKRNAELEARLIDDLLDLTRISKGKVQLNLETVDAHTLLHNVLEICRSDVAAKQLTVELELKATRRHVMADPARIQQVFWNLVKNAVKFTPDGGTVTIRSCDTETGELLVEVIDDGIGIEADVLPRIFNAFEQGEQTITRRFGGLGLGLAISKMLVDMHGGSIVAESEGSGQGARFAVRLAAVASAGVAPADGEPRAGDETARGALRILVVDDHEDTGRVMKLLLERRGYQVLTAGDVRSALEVAAHQPFDLLISDIGLPDGSGVELMEELRKIRPVKGIALSGFGMEQDVRKSKEAGFYEHLTKPVSFQRLQEVIQEMTV